AREKLTPYQLAIGALLLGIGICGMHYTGMAAMQMDADLRYIPGPFFLSFAIAVVASALALGVAFTLARKVSRHRYLLQIIAAFILGAGICGMHYTGMAGAVFLMHSDMHHHAQQSYDMMAVTIAAITSIILGLALVAGTYRRTQTEAQLHETRALLAAI